MNNQDKEFLVEKIRTQYTEKEHTSLDALKELDAKVKRPANVLAYTLGSVGAIIMGSGMSLIMTDIGATLGMEEVMIPGIIVGIIGMLISIFNYSLYKTFLGSRRKKYGKEILALSETIMKTK